MFNYEILQRKVMIVEKDEFLYWKGDKKSALWIVLYGWFKLEGKEEEMRND